MNFKASYKNLNQIALIAVAVIVILFIVLIVRPFDKETANNTIGSLTTPKVVATIFPIYDIAKNIAGDVVEVELILPPGASPHTYEPTPSAITLISNALSIYVIGHGADDWLENLISGNLNESMNIVTVDRGIDIHKTDDSDYDDEHEEEANQHHNGSDPHYWLSPVNAMEISKTIADDLKNLFPNNADTIETNLQNYLTKLTEADLFIEDRLSSLSNRNMVTLHDAWYYFAKRYNLEIVGSFEPTAGREPTPQYLATLGHAVTRSGVKTIYSEPQLSTDILIPFLKDHNLSVATLDPLGGIEGRNTYIDTMIYNAETILQNR